MRHLITAAAATIATAFSIGLIAAPASADDDGFAYLSRTGEQLQTHHSLQYVFSADADWRVAEPLHRTARFNDVPWQISLSAFVQTDRVMTVFAEHVADMSGVANYTHYPVSDWPVAGFRSRPAYCLELDQAEVDEEHDFRWLEAQGFSPVGAIWFAQYFLSGNDFNDEIVVSLLIRAPSCDDADQPSAGLAEMRAALRVSAAASEAE